jgi:GT2 family glycosyltransferase
MKSVSIIIPTYNGLHYLKDCIATIRMHTPIPHEIIVVDNGSSDGTVEFCRDERLVFVANPDNPGFPGACNAGMKIASGDALLLLNNDVLVPRHWLSNMLNCLYSGAEIGIVGPMTNYGSGKQQIDFPYTNLEEVAAHLHHVNRGNWLEVRRIIGLCMLIKREVMERIGCLDERFAPGHYEDDDYCYRARMAGYRLMIAQDAFVFHYGSSSFNREGEARVQQLLQRNRGLFIEKWGMDPAQIMD